jgi:hypothetical protein
MLNRRDMESDVIEKRLALQGDRPDQAVSVYQL